MERYGQIFGLKIAVGDRGALLARARSLIGRGGIIATVNPVMLTTALSDKELYGVLRSSLNIPDGVGVVRALAKRGIHTERIAGVELGEELIATYEGELSLAIIGGAPGVARGAMDALRTKYPNLKEAFVADGFYTSRAEIETLMRSTRPEVVFAALGCPKQELLCRDLRHLVPHCLFIGLGGSADVYSGRVRRAPRIFRRLGLEWLYRMVREPRRIKSLKKMVSFAILSSGEKKVKIKQ